jgi:hypothetical protein
MKTTCCVCRATPKDVVTWRKDNVVIMSNATRVTVDMFSILHLADVTQASEGNYTCFVGDTRMQEVIVYVAPATNLRTEGKCVVLLQQCMCMMQLAVSIIHVYIYILILILIPLRMS